MLELLNSNNLVVVAAAIAGGVVLIISLFAMIAKFYRRCGADEALVRTGAGGNKVVIGGGIMVYPILHQLQRVSLRSVKLSVERAGRMALVTADKIKANVSTELFIKVEPLGEDVLAAARSFGERNLDEHAIGDLIEGKLTDALRSVSANKTFMALHSERKEFAEAVQSALAEELKKNGLTLENVSITAFAMIPVTELDERDVFDADGLRAITESVQANREKTNQIQREKENAIQETNVRARMRQLELDQAQAFAEAEQHRRVQEYAAAQASETAKAIFIQEQSRDMAAYDKSQAVETARIQQEAAIAVAEADKQRRQKEAMIGAEKALQAAEIAKRREIEAASIEKETVVQSEEEQARASAAKALALADEEKARQAIVTASETAHAERERQKKVIDAQAEADVRVALARGEIAEAEARALAAMKEAEAIETLAKADLSKKSAEAEAQRRYVEAQNAVSMKLVARDLALKAIEVMPALAHELMEPARHISEIKVLQTQNPGNGNSAQGAMGAASPILKTILEAGAAYPIMRELVGFAGNEKLGEQVKALLGEIAGPPASESERAPEAAE
jgi:uncharacterized membrane protein YqiK